MRFLLKYYTLWKNSKIKRNKNQKYQKLDKIHNKFKQKMMFIPSKIPKIFYNFKM